MELLRLLIGTIALRPYVFIFFGLYLFIAVCSIGWKRTAVFTLLAYVVAFVCEYTSSHGDSGIPFGVYRYIESTRDRELWIAGVPFMDSLSFTFLSFISYECAVLLLSPLTVSRGDVIVLRQSRLRHSLFVAALAGFLMMYLDIIIDPVTLQGKRWFLGQIYYYPEGGAYFGVTIANFIGWFIVCFVIVLAFIGLEKLRGLRGDEPVVRRYRFQSLAPAVLYFGVLGFNLWVTFSIGEVTLGWVGVFICLPLVASFSAVLWRAHRHI
jgi:uncharacterized membrane protein